MHDHANSSKISLSVVMPAYNEEDNISQSVQDVQTHVLTLVPDAELIVVDDGSKDRTAELLDKMADADKRIIVLHQRNSGHGPSLLAGMKAARGERILLIDSDRQIPLDCFASLWHNAPDTDAIFAIRMNRQDPLIRLWLSKLIGVCVKMFFGTNATDLNAPCKLFKRGLFEDFRNAIPADDILAPSIMLNIFARRHGYKIQEVAVKHLARAKGESSLKPIKLMVFCWNGLRQLMQYRDRLV